MPSPLIFTPELLAKCPKDPKRAVPLLHRLATLEGRGGEAIRAQIERAAASVPEQQRPRVLGALLRNKSSSDDQVRATIGSLLLAKTLEDMGWSVEHEPEEAEGTPDLRIQKDGRQYLVEIRRVIDNRRKEDEMGLLRVRDALRHIETNTPLMLHSVKVSGSASLKRFVKHIERALSGPRPTGLQEFSEKDVLICYEVCPPLSDGLKVLAASYLPMEIIHGFPTDDIRKAINEKLGKYKVPLIVALDLVDSYLSFDAVESVLFGERAFTFDFDPEQGLVGEPRPGRTSSGLLVKRGADSDRARNRLLAALPFRLKVTDPDNPFQLHACLLANPAQEPPHDFKEFAPFPRLVVTSETAEGLLLQYRGEDDGLLTSTEAAQWNHHP
jgi:hypothetical protein